MKPLLKTELQFSYYLQEERGVPHRYASGDVMTTPRKSFE